MKNIQLPRFTSMQDNLLGRTFEIRKPDNLATLEYEYFKDISFINSFFLAINVLTVIIHQDCCTSPFCKCKIDNFAATLFNCNVVYLQ